MAGPGGSPERDHDGPTEEAPRSPRPSGSGHGDLASGEGALGRDSAGEGDEALEEEPRPWWARVLVALLIVAMVLFLSPWVVRLFLPPIHPAQRPPPGHYAWQCNTCHNVTPAVDLKTYPVYE